jgi:DNA-binding FrmR family transcriptional regulator
MSHIVKQRKQLLARVNRLIGQMTALKKSLEDAQSEQDCRSVMQQLASIRGALTGLQMVYLEEFLRQHVARGATVKARVESAEELLEALKSYGVSR